MAGALAATAARRRHRRAARRRPGASADIDGVTLLDMDDLRGFAAAGVAGRRREVAAAEAILDDELERYLDASSAREVAPLVIALRERAEAVRQAELERFRAAARRPRRRPGGAVDAVDRGDSWPSCCTSRPCALKDAAGIARGDRLAAALRELFELEALRHRGMRPLRVATRGSALARWQADHVAVLAQKAEPGLERRDGGGRDQRRPPTRRPHLGTGRQGRVRQGGAGRRARGPGRRGGPLGQGPAVADARRPGDRGRARAGRCRATPWSARRSPPSPPGRWWRPGRCAGGRSWPTCGPTCTFDGPARQHRHPAGAEGGRRRRGGDGRRRARPARPVRPDRRAPRSRR